MPGLTGGLKVGTALVGEVNQPREVGDQFCAGKARPRGAESERGEQG
jgi:hypothetical protein